MHSGEERRKYVRITYESVVECEKFSIPRNHESVREFNIKNISAGGVLFESFEKYEIGDILKIKISAQGWEKYLSEFYKPERLSVSEPIVALGKVVRIEDLGNGNFDIGVEFIGIDEMHRKAFDKFIKKQKENI